MLYMYHLSTGWSRYYQDKSGVKRLNTLGHLDLYMAYHGETVILWNSLGDDFVYFKLGTTALEAPFHFGFAFPKCTGVETVKQSLNSIETNQGLFHSLNAHRHNANK